MVQFGRPGSMHPVTRQSIERAGPACPGHDLMETRTPAARLRRVLDRCSPSSAPGVMRGSTIRGRGGIGQPLARAMILHPGLGLLDRLIGEGSVLRIERIAT
jgi:hypothetical protein